MHADRRELKAADIKAGGKKNEAGMLEGLAQRSAEALFARGNRRVADPDRAPPFGPLPSAKPSGAMIAAYPARISKVMTHPVPPISTCV